MISVFIVFNVEFKPLTQKKNSKAATFIDSRYIWQSTFALCFGGCDSTSKKNLTECYNPVNAEANGKTTLSTRACGQGAGESTGAGGIIL